MKMSMSGGAGLGLVVKISCPTCGREETFKHEGFSGVSCDKKPCAARQTITQDREALARLKAGE